MRFGSGLGRLACAGLSDTPTVISVLGLLQGPSLGPLGPGWQDTPDKFRVRGPIR